MMLLRNDKVFIKGFLDFILSNIDFELELYLYDVPDFLFNGFWPTLGAIHMDHKGKLCCIKVDTEILNVEDFKNHQHFFFF